MSFKQSKWYASSVIIIGILLFLVGIAALVIPQFSYTTHEPLLELGPIKASTETKQYLLIPPVVGIVIAGVGAVLTVAGFFWKKS